MNVLMFGPPGAGKGTQSTLLVNKLSMAHISTGDLFRAAIKNQTPLGMKAKSFMDAGQLVPDDVTIGLVEEVLQSLKGRSFILDGFPRTVPQAEALNELLVRHGLKIDRALSFEVPRILLLQRLTGRRVCSNCGAVYHIDNHPTKVLNVCDNCGMHNTVVQRKDDHADVITARLEAYDKSTAPVKTYYQNANALVAIDGTGSEQDVFSRVEKSLKSVS